MRVHRFAKVLSTTGAVVLLAACGGTGDNANSGTDTSIRTSIAGTTSTVPSRTVEDGGAAGSAVPANSGPWSYARQGAGDEERRSAETIANGATLTFSDSELTGQQVRLTGAGIEGWLCPAGCNGAVEVDGKPMDVRWTQPSVGNDPVSALSLRESEEVFEFALDGASTITVMIPADELTDASSDLEYTFDISGLDPWIDE